MDVRDAVSLLARTMSKSEGESLVIAPAVVTIRNDTANANFVFIVPSRIDTAAAARVPDEELAAAVTGRPLLQTGISRY